MNDEEISDGLIPIDRVWEEIANRTFLDGFTDTSRLHLLPAEVLVRLSELRRRQGGSP
jgi:hypothetical protein